MSTESANIAVQPPVAARKHTERTVHGHTLVDDYAWLREKDNPEVMAYLEAENAWCSAVMAGTEDLQKQLYEEMLSHIKETDVSVPFRDREYWYYSRTEQGQQYEIYCRKRGADGREAPEGDEEILLDVNELAKNESFMALGTMVVSDDGNLLAYSCDNRGFRQYKLYVKDLRTGEVLAERADRVGSVVWAADNRTLFYTVEDEEQKRQFQLLPACAGRAACGRRAGVRGEGRAIQHWRGADARRPVHHSGELEPHDDRRAVSAGG